MFSAPSAIQLQTLFDNGRTQGFVAEHIFLCELVQVVAFTLILAARQIDKVAGAIYIIPGTRIGFDLHFGAQCFYNWINKPLGYGLHIKRPPDGVKIVSHGGNYARQSLLGP